MKLARQGRVSHHRGVLITLTSRLVVMTSDKETLNCREQANAFIDLGLSGIPRIGSRKRASRRSMTMSPKPTCGPRH